MPAASYIKNDMAIDGNKNGSNRFQFVDCSLQYAIMVNAGTNY
jgi:hypothetical protein